MGLKPIIGLEDFFGEGRRVNSELESANPAAPGRISKEPRPAGPQEVTQLLANWSHGDHAALEKLIPLVYEELRRLSSLYEGATSRSHAANNGVGERGLSASCGPEETKLYEPVALFCRGGQSDAPDPRRSCKSAATPKAGRGCKQNRPGRGSADLARADRSDSRSQ